MESLSSGPACSADFSNKDIDSMTSSSENHSVKDDFNDKGQVDKAGTEEIIESTAKEDMAPMAVVVTGSTGIADLETNDVNTFDLTNATTPNSTQSNTAFGTFDLTAHNLNASRFVTGSKNILGQQELKYEPELNLCQEEVL
eukprot:13546912-Ditylum_brightwellii.AAC.1